jgi:hypothetical protein
MSVFGRTVLGAAIARIDLLRSRACDPRRSQERALLRLVERACSTTFGRAHGFRAIGSIEAFRDRVPVRSYAELDPWFARARAGEPNVVWPGRVRYFGMSSGTTAGNKYVPISRASVKQQQRGGFLPLASYLAATRNAAVTGGKFLLLGGSSKLEERAGGILVGDNTGIMAHHVPRVVRAKYLPRPETRAISEWDAKILAVAREAVTEDVRVIAGTPSWFSGLFDAVCDEARRRGKRARHVRDVWPNLELLTGGGISFEPYRAFVEERVGGAVAYVDVYNATEGGIMGVQDRLELREMLLVPDDGVFYEFIPADEASAPSPKRLSIWEVEVGQTYAIAVSTMSGLFAYRIGDCVRFTSAFPHRFVFEGRLGGFLNVAGEHVSQGEIERAVRRAAIACGWTIAEFTVGSEVRTSSTAHVYYLELAGMRDPPAAERERFAAIVDADLREGNGDYDAHRVALGLSLPDVRIVPPGTFYAFMKARSKLGGQHKVPRVLANGVALPTILAGSDAARA